MSNHWPRKTLDSIFTISRGGSPRPIDAFITEDPDGVNWIMIGDAAEGAKYITSTKKRIIRSGVSRSRVVKPGDFLLTNSMSFGRPYILQIDGCIHDGWLVLSPRDENVSRDFFYHLLGSEVVFAEFERKAAGVTVKNLNIDLVKAVEVPLPPLSEQRRIADVLDRAEALRAKRRAALGQLDTLTQAIFVEMFGDQHSSGNIETAILSDCAEVVSGIAKGRNLDGRKTVMAPYLRVANVQAGFLNLNEIKEIEALPAEVTELRLLQGDIVLTEGGDFDKLGRGAMWEGQIAECIHQNHVFRVRVQPKRLVPRFFHVYLQMPAAKSYFLRCAKKTTNLASINMTQLRALPVLLPPLNQQQQFAHRVAAVEQLRSSHRASLVQMDELFAALQYRAFRGEL